MKSPPKEKPLLGGEGLLKRIEAGYAAQAIWQGWRWEALRLFAEYWRSGDSKHLAAFVRHVAAMHAYKARAIQ